MTKIMTLNIRNGGGVHRLEAIMNRIDMHSPDVLVLTEYRENHNSGRLREYLTKNRFLYLAAGSNDSSINSVLIASKVRFTPFMFEDFVEPEGAKSLLGARFENFHLIGCSLSGLSEDNEAMKYLLENASGFFKGQYWRDFGVVIGSVKSTNNIAGEEPLTYLRGMEDQGLVGLYCEKESCASECSIQSQNHNFFRKSFAFVTSDFNKRISSVACYPVESTQEKLDHSEMIFEVNFSKRMFFDWMDYHQKMILKR